MQHPHFALQDGLCWTATTRLASWAGFQARAGAYGAKSSSFPSNGSVTVCFAPEGRGREPLTSSEIALVNWFFEHEAEVSESLQRTLVDEYAELRVQHGCDAEGAADMHDVRDVEDLKLVIGLHTVNIHQVNRDGVPYLGFEFGCDWEEEHGLGVLMHGTQVVEIGDADTAILLWLAEQHSKAGAGEA